MCVVASHSSLSFSVAGIRPHLFNHSTVGGHLGSFQCEALERSGAKNILVQVLTDVHIPVECIPRSRIAGLWCMSVFSFIRYSQVLRKCLFSEWLSGSKNQGDG